MKLELGPLPDGRGSVSNGRGSVSRVRADKSELRFWNRVYRNQGDGTLGRDRVVRRMEIQIFEAKEAGNGSF